jgi:hypothetical protein
MSLYDEPREKCSACAAKSEQCGGGRRAREGLRRRGVRLDRRKRLRNEGGGSEIEGDGDTNYQGLY